jgi:hypothetical protein
MIEIDRTDAPDTCHSVIFDQDEYCCRMDDCGPRGLNADIGESYAWGFLETVCLFPFMTFNILFRTVKMIGTWNPIQGFGALDILLRLLRN